GNHPRARLCLDVLAAGRGVLRPVPEPRAAGPTDAGADLSLASCLPGRRVSAARQRDAGCSSHAVADGPGSGRRIAGPARDRVRELGAAGVSAGLTRATILS